MVKSKKIFFIILNLLIGCVFIASAISKLVPIEPFEFSFVETKIFGWQSAPFIARVFIGLEFYIGVLFILNTRALSFAYYFALALLALFSAYLIILLFRGDQENCGCFGEWFPMTPLQAIFKNIILASAVIFSMRNWFGWGRVGIWLKYQIWIVGGISLCLPFILNQVKLDYSQAYLNRPEDTFEMPMDTLFKNYSLRKPPLSLYKGKHVFCFFSLKCPHCKIAAKKIGLIHQMEPSIDFFMVLNGKRSDVNGFLRRTNTEKIGYSLLLGDRFTYMAGIHLPVIFLINNSQVEHILHYKELSQQELKEWSEK
jgi:hypothetical protein